MNGWVKNSGEALAPRPCSVAGALAGLGLLLVLQCHAGAALAELSGGSGYSGALSHNATIRHQQLICDPAPGNGSASVSYDPSVVSLYSIFNEADYSLQDAYVGVLVGSSREVEAASSYFGSGTTGLPEWGYVQVGWSGPNSANAMSTIIGNTPTTTGYSLDATAGPSGANTFGLEFTYLPATDDVVASYTVYADSTGYPIYDGTGDSPPDSITDSSDPNQTPITDISPATVAAALPEPAMGLFLVCGMAAIFASRGPEKG